MYMHKLNKNKIPDLIQVNKFVSTNFQGLPELCYTQLDCVKQIPCLNIINITQSLCLNIEVWTSHKNKRGKRSQHLCHLKHSEDIQSILSSTKHGSSQPSELHFSLNSIFTIESSITGTDLLNVVHCSVVKLIPAYYIEI